MMQKSNKIYNFDFAWKFRYHMQMMLTMVIAIKDKYIRCLKRSGLNSSVKNYLLERNKLAEEWNRKVKTADMY